MADNDEQWWFCTRHLRVEPAGTSCPGKDLLGPYKTAGEASRALEQVKERNAAWDAEE